MGLGSVNPLAQALARLWAQHLPEIQARVAVLESSAQSLVQDTNRASTREEAASAAHKLTGVLGTFGLHRGTELAREAEALCGSDAPDPLELSQRLAEIAEALRGMIALEKSSTPNG